MTDASKLRRIKRCLDASKRYHALAINVITDAADGDITPKDAYADTRRHLEASSTHLDSAHQHLLRLLRDRHDAADDTNEELSTTASRRKALLDDLDRRGGVARARSTAPVALGGGGHTTAYRLDRELKRLRSLQ
jgi:hypothetical protein